MKVKIKKLNENAVIPSYSKQGDAGLDLTATSMTTDEYGNIVYGTGLAFEIPEGYVGLLFQRSSVCKKNIILTNCTGILDSNYRGEVLFKFKYISDEYKHGMHDYKYNIGDRIGQIIIMPYPTIEFIECDTLSETNRGSGGFGSTGV